MQNAGSGGLCFCTGSRRCASLVFTRCCCPPLQSAHLKKRQVNEILARSKVIEAKRQAFLDAEIKVSRAITGVRLPPAQASHAQHDVLWLCSLEACLRLAWLCWGCVCLFTVC